MRLRLLSRLRPIPGGGGHFSTVEKRKNPRSIPKVFESFPLSKKSTVVQKSTVVILAELVPIGDAAPQALRGLRGGWRSPRRRLRALRASSCGGSAPSRAAKPCAASTGGPAANIPSAPPPPNNPSPLPFRLRLRLLRLCGSGSAAALALRLLRLPLPSAPHPAPNDGQARPAHRP